MSRLLMQTHSPSVLGHRLLSRAALAGVMVVALSHTAPAAPVRSGEQIYRQQCASCHGQSGEGSKEYDKPLAGKKSLPQLVRYIARSMPDDNPGTCVGEDAEKVAAYVYEAFYSAAAQARNKPPRIELSRLTVRQYRNAVTDLVGSFRVPGTWDGPHGLRGEYYKSRRFRPAERVFTQTDPAVRFDFGVHEPQAIGAGQFGPEPELLDPSQFSIRWEGSVLAPETGEYEFIVRTEHATRFWINDLKKPLIDAWVKSGNDTEYRASIHLLGGRVYPLRLEFSKAKQGVDDSKKTKTKPPPVKASIALEWKLPHQTPEVIPQRNLTPHRFPETFVLATPFPPDDRSVGYERGTSISKAWEQATTDAAIEVADYVARHLDELAGLKAVDHEPGPGSGNPAQINLDRKDGPALPVSERERKLRAFAAAFAERAFRRPLSDEQKRLYIDHQFAAAKDLETAVKRVVLFVLKSPRFLYREIGGGADAYDTAARLSFDLWDSLPDQQLLDAAASGQLATREQVMRQAERMVTDLRARAKLRAFFLQWLKVEDAPDVAKDPKEFPGFSKEVISDLRTSLDLFLDDVVWSEASDFRELLLADSLYLNGRLAGFYGVDLPSDAPFCKVPMGPGGVRAGLLTHPYLMATFSYTSTTSPIHRGVFLARSVLGQSLRPPPEAAAPLAPELHPNLTTRERVLLQTSPQACQTCHGMINPLGFTLENFDAVGRFRQKEKGKPIDATGAYQTRSGELVKFAGVRDLANFLAGSEEVHEAFVEQLFHFLVKQPIRAFGPRRPAELRESFERNEFNIRKLVIEIVAASALPSE